MKRDINKPSYPNYFEASAGGSALAGESTEEAILRELEEETGITPLTLTFLDRNLYRKDACFIATADCPKSAVRLQEEETTDYCWVPLEQLTYFIANHLVIPRQVELLKD
ncbi:NUDIX domain-containing protein [Streptococcus caballi]|uniref:NUDIX domain-containing protein n=1 Tax=Streptococcus caballi TaxID=439220 RepID=UPI0003A2DA87|nr:NUDIX domain-containing protein [Streptococcus caballi]